MAICTVCGAGSPEGTLRCASCGNPFSTVGPAGPVIGEVFEETGTAPQKGSWGSGTVHSSRGDRLRIDRAWLAAPRALIAPTLLLLATALLLTDVAGNVAFFAQKDDFGHRYGMWLAGTLTVFGAPLRQVTSMEHGNGSVTNTLDIRLVPITLLLAWAALLTLGLRRELRARLRRDPARPTLRQAGVESLRAALASGLVTLLLAAVSGTDIAPVTAEKTVSFSLSTHLSAGIVTWQAVLGSAVGAGLLALAVYGPHALAELAGRRTWTAGWPAAVRVSVRTALIGLAPAAVAGIVALVAGGGSTPGWVYPVFLGNVAMFVYGIGTGARTDLPPGFVGMGGADGAGDQSFSLLDLGGHTAQWWWAVLPVLASAVLLGVLAHRRRLTPVERLQLTAVHTAVTAALVLAAGISMTLATASHRNAAAVGTAGGAADGDHSMVVASIGWSLPSVLIAAALWAALGALAVPALLDLVRPLPPLPAAPAVPGTAAEPEPAPEAHGLVETVEEVVLPAQPSAAATADAHAAYRRPDEN